MIPQEAYKECKTFFDNDGIGELDAVAFSMALNALEKQIPKKPISQVEKTYWGDDVDEVFLCSHCGMFICHSVELDCCKDDYTHCHCGQKIDWSDIV